ncbi:MAG: OmpA family protein [Sulfurimonas sp.]|uniref:OmpA family protein n=1 Tax=Sulfurimonas sp. TaxID=2022749 RepID=UPI0025EB213C|nr:OmpA family protein [Sulfurimonas sp.]MCK9490681.1 OmpA family protein [Sulfurimonas sp.]
MKKLLLIPTLLLSSSLMMAADYEITPMIGYNIAENNIDLDDYATFGAEFQYNAFDFFLKPELSVFYSKADYNTNRLPNGADTDVWRLALNGVYEFDKVAGFIPLTKVGLGYETMNGHSYKGQTGNTDSAFINAGFGAKIPFTDMLALKLEAVYMLKYNDTRYDNNLALLAGLNFAFGSSSQKTAPAQESKPVEQIKEEPEEELVEEAVMEEEVTSVVAVVDGDDDKDGVANSIDICPNTPIGQAVNSDGCPLKITLDINFEYDSAKVDAASEKLVQEYADFLNKYTNYSTKIVGHTDSIGSETYNQKLSQRRATSVRDMLIEKGVDAQKVTAVGKGELEPIADNTTAEGRAENRRIEAELIRN